ncbi:MAG: hypothetical protein JXA96_17335 [Sedimentisphaerales bacterium]|nr:hypothetical protein [Sedimentisphaerales bacterium]
MDKPIETPVEAPPNPEPVPEYIGKDGSLKDGWKGLLDEDIREEKSLDQFKHIKGLAKSFLYTKKMVGADVMPVPNEKWTNKEWNEFYDKVGRPPVATDYNFIRPPELPAEHYSEKVAMEAMELFHGLGFTPKQAKTVFDFHNNLVIQALKAEQQNRKLEAQTAKDDLINELGAAYQSREHLGNQALEIGCKGATPTPEEDEELKKILIEDYGANPWFTRFMMNIGKHFAEHTSEIVSTVPTPGDLQQQITEIMSKPEYTSKDIKVRQPLIDKVQRLYEQINKSKGIS